MPMNERVFQRTIHGVLREKVTQSGDRTFFTFKDRAYTYADLDNESDRVAAGLRGLGVALARNTNTPEVLSLLFLRVGPFS